jgi:hypothetical protein
MFVNRIKICPDLHKLRFDFLGLFIFKITSPMNSYKMGRFLITLKHSRPIFIWYSNSRLNSARVCISDKDRQFMF